MGRSDFYRKIPWEKPWFQTLIRLGLAAGLSIFLLQIDLNYLEFQTYDIRVRTKPASPHSQHIRLVSIDTATVEDLQRDPNALDYIDLIQLIGPQKPKAIVFINDLSEVAGSFEDLERFSKLVALYPVYAILSEAPSKMLVATTKLPPPLENIPLDPGSKTTDGVSFGRDGVSRRLVYIEYDKRTLLGRLADDITRARELHNYQGLFDYRETKQVLIDFHPIGTYTQTSFKNVVQGRIGSKEFTDKVVFVGRDNQARTDDYVLSPMSRDPLAMSRLELNANILDTLILDRGIRRPPGWVNYVLTFVISLITIFVVLTLRPGRGLFLLLSSVVAFSLVSLAAMAAFQLALPMAHPLLAVFVCYYFLIPYRLIMENRKSWEYYQRNQLLMQVEELKSNFMRMMSHDLKTPLARIQGMANLIVQTGPDLHPMQIDAVETIRKSSEELADFIGSILSLGRIESKEIKLQLRSKDINTLLNEVIRKCEFLAKTKGITVITEYEPLFSTRIDEDLMRQVFTNLLENAIKYSPENSKIMVSSEEVDGKVVVQVADQGIGIPTEDIPNIFGKFFRSRSVTNTDIKGSGLGLYLSQYFVNLHRGQISVESELNRGSTFTVELPMELEA